MTELEIAELDTAQPDVAFRDIAALVERAAAGEEDAWRQLVGTYTHRMTQVARGYRLGEAQAADAVATTWLKLVEHISTLRDGARVVGWLMTTLRRECLAQLQKTHREVPVEEFLGPNEPTDDVALDQRLLTEERRRMVRVALAQLPRPQRQLLDLLFADPAPSYQEISARLSIPIGSIGPTRNRSLRKLHDLMTSEQPSLALAV